jgi:hypothetical protein
MDTYSAVLRNTHGDDTSFEALYAVLALQMLPHAVGFLLKSAPGRRRQSAVLSFREYQKKISIFPLSMITLYTIPKWKILSPL